MSLFNSHWWTIPLLITFFSGVLCPAMGTVLITHKRLLQANLISHCVLPGLALAVAAGVDASIGGVISGLVGAIFVENLTITRKENYSAIMNTVLSGSLGLGVLLIPLLGIRVDLEAVLFGDLLTANMGDLFRTLIAFLSFTCLMIFGYNKLVYVGLDPEGAEANGVNVFSLNLLLGLTTAFVIVSSMAAVGVILVIALLSTPALLGLSGATSLSGAMRKASMIGIGISLLGFLLAIIFNLAPGPLISVICIVSLTTMLKKQ